MVAAPESIAQVAAVPTPSIADVKLANGFKAAQETEMANGNGAGVYANHGGDTGKSLPPGCCRGWEGSLGAYAGGGRASGWVRTARGNLCRFFSTRAAELRRDPRRDCRACSLLACDLEGAWGDMGQVGASWGSSEGLGDSRGRCMRRNPPPLSPSRVGS